METSTYSSFEGTETQKSLVDFQGTAKDFAEHVSLNGHPLDQMTVNSLAKHGLIETVGEGQKPARGRTPKKYKAVTREGFVLAAVEKE